MTDREYGRLLAADAPPLTPDQVETAARLLAFEAPTEAA